MDDVWSFKVGVRSSGVFTLRDPKTVVREVSAAGLLIRLKSFEISIQNFYESQTQY
jgi:hypothetical protein